MTTVFSGTLPSISRPEELHGRADCCNKLETLLAQPRNVIVLGPKGVGKASLLGAYLSPQYRVQALLERRRLYYFTPDFPEHLPEGDALGWFCEQIASAIEDIHRLALLCGLGSAPAPQEPQPAGLAGVLQGLMGRRPAAPEQPAPADQLEQLYQTLHGLVASHAAAADSHARFHQLLDDCASAALQVTLVVQHFQSFTCSREVTGNHLDRLRAMTQTGRLSLLAATDYSFDKLASTELTGGSAFLHTFMGNDLKVGGWSKADTCGYLSAALGGEEGERFAARYGALIHQASGGIPVLVRYLADNLLQNPAQKPDSEASCKEACQAAIEAVLPQAAHYFRDWCRQLTYTQIEVLKNCAAAKTVADLTQLYQKERETVNELKARGLLETATQRLKNGSTIELPALNCALFRRYVQRTDLLAENQKWAQATDEALTQRLCAETPDPARNREDMRTLLEASASAHSDPYQEYQDLWAAFEKDPAHIPPELLVLHSTPAEVIDAYSDFVRNLLFQALLMEKYLAPMLMQTASQRPVEATACGVLYFKVAEAAMLETLGAVMERCAPEDYAVIRYGDKVPSLGDYLKLMRNAEARMKYQPRSRALDNRWWTAFSYLLQLMANNRNAGPHPIDEEGFQLGNLDAFTGNLFGPQGLLAHGAALLAHRADFGI